MGDPYVTIDVTTEGISASMWVDAKDGSPILLDETHFAWAELISDETRPGRWQSFSETVRERVSHTSATLES
jgi:hypothetical protein